MLKSNVIDKNSAEYEGGCERHITRIFVRAKATAEERTVSPISSLVASLLGPLRLLVSYRSPLLVALLCGKVASFAEVCPSSSSSRVNSRYRSIRADSLNLWMSSSAVLESPTYALSSGQQVNIGKDISAAVMANENIQNSKSNQAKRPKHLTTPLTKDRWEFGRKLTENNKKHSEMGVKFRKSYTTLRTMTRHEETMAGKFSSAGATIEKARESLKERLGRNPELSEIATESNICVTQVDMYEKMAKTARRRLVQHNIRLVDFCARQILSNTKAARDIPYYELVVEGVKGLSDAAEKYDGRVPFIKYAQHFVRSALYRGLTSLKPGAFSIAQNSKAAVVYLRAKKVYGILKEQLGRAPTDAEIATYMTRSGLHVSRETIQWARDVMNVKVISAETNLGCSTDGSCEDGLNTYLDLYLKADQADISIDKMLWNVDFNSAMNCLSPQEKRTLSIRYGLMDGTPRTVERTAELMCITPEGVRLIVASALEKLRQSPDAALLMEGPPQSPLTTTNGKLGAVSY
jgi:RNA polymerase sigma factor (sigma-70 family)